VDKDVVEKGALLHDIGYLRLKGELVELPEWKPYGIKFPSDDINHPSLGEIIVRDWGFTQEVADCVLKHNIGGFTLSECKLLKIDPMPTKDCAARTLEQKVVHFADHLILLERIKINPFEDPQASAGAVFPWLRYNFAERANMNITIDSPVVQREVTLNRELCKYVKPSWIGM
jgi:putative nucleotidyltransferase with HDIG domain